MMSERYEQTSAGLYPDGNVGDDTKRKITI